MKRMGNPFAQNKKGEIRHLMELRRLPPQLYQVCKHAGPSV